jgi:hypothetical protein
VDWPPIGSSLLPEYEYGNTRQDDNTSLRSPVSDVPPRQTFIDRSDYLAIKTEENGNDSILLCRKALLSPIEELDEVEVLERHRHRSLDCDSGSSCAEVFKTVADHAFLGPVVSDDDREPWGLSERNHTPDSPPIWTPSSPHSSRQDCSSVANTSMSLACRDHVSEPPSPRIVDLPLPVFPRIDLPRFSLSPLGIRKVLESPLPSSEPGNDHSNTEVGSAAPEPLLDGLLSSAQNGEFHSTGNCCSNRTWNFLSLTIIFYSLINKKPRRFRRLTRCLTVRCHERRARVFVGQCLRIMSV